MCFDAVMAEIKRLASEKEEHLKAVAKTRNDANQLLMAEANVLLGPKKGRGKAKPKPVTSPKPSKAEKLAKPAKRKAKRRPVLHPKPEVFCHCGNKIPETMPRHTKTCSVNCRKKRSLKLASDYYERKKQEEGWYRDRQEKNRAAYIERRGPKKCKSQECQRPLDINDPKQTCSDRCRRELIRISVRNRRNGTKWI